MFSGWFDSFWKGFIGRLQLQINLASAEVLSGMPFCPSLPLPPPSTPAQWLVGAEHLFIWGREVLLLYLLFSGW